MPNTTPASDNEFTALEKTARQPTVVDNSAAALELALQKEADERREERFYWICACAFFIDLATFPHLSWIAVICVFLLEIAVLLGLARKYADENIAIVLERIVISICDKFGWKQ